jgi:hypothetical protein
MYAFDAPLVARFFAIEELRAAGWKHRPDPALAALPRSRRDDAERMWSGATFCPECAARAAGAAGAVRKTPPSAYAQALGSERREGRERRGEET